MMEKPLAVDNTQARAIQKAAASSGIAVMVNYETTWYKSHGEIWKLIKEQNAAGEIRKMVAMDGHQGPEGDQCPAGVPLLADGSGEKRRRGAVRFRLLRRQPDDLG